MKSNIQNTKKMKILFWMPRILAIIYVCFLAIFALDVFIPGQTILYYVVALSMHLLPNFIMLVLLLISWKYEKGGGLLFIILALGFTFFFKTYVFFLNFLFISIPLFSIGGLFLIHDFMSRKEKDE